MPHRLAPADSQHDQPLPHLRQMPTAAKKGKEGETVTIFQQEGG
jgi:hypothetical protein